MAKMRKILALVLVMAMTFSMLPIFAAAEEVVGEVAAVETVEAPAAEAPVVEAPAAEAPAAEIPVVEDVAEIPAETPADVPVVEAIETVATEAVAELQAIDETHVAAVYPLIEGENGALVWDTENGVGYTSLISAYNAACELDYLCEVVLLKDYVEVAGTTGKNRIPVFNKAFAYASANLDNTSDPDVAVKGFWLNLNDHTYTLCHKSTSGTSGSAFILKQNEPLNIKGGTFIFRFARQAMATSSAVISCGLGMGATADRAFRVLDDEGNMYNPSVTIKDASLIRTLNPSSSVADGGPVMIVSSLKSNIKIIDSTLLSARSSQNAIQYKKNQVSKFVGDVQPEGELVGQHDLYIKNSTLGSKGSSASAIYGTTVALPEDPTNALDVKSISLNVTIDGAAEFLGNSAFNMVEDGPTLNLTSCTYENVVGTKSVAYPSSTAVDNIADTGASEATAPAYDAAATETTLIYAKDDAGLAGRGVVTITSHPDEATTAYYGATAINTAYKHGAEWTTPGGIVRLVTDYTHVDAKSRGAYGVINNGASMTNVGTYEIADAADYPADLDIKGFWFDLGGHTFIARTGWGLVATTAANPYFNFRNGRIIHQFTTAQTSNYNMMKHGTTGGGSAEGGPKYTFDHIELIKVGNSKLSNNGGAMFYMNMVQSQINIIDSKIITDRATSLVQYPKGESVATSVPFKHEINIYGNSVLGSTAADQSVFKVAAGATDNGFDDDGIYLKIAEDATPIFLGTTLTEFPATIEGKGDFATKKYVLSDEKYTGYTMPDVTSFAEETGPAGALNLAAPVSCNMLEPAKGDDTTATYTSNDGTVTVETTLSGAVTEWEKTHSGTITLTGDVTEDQSRVVLANVGGLGKYYKPYTSSGSSVAVEMSTIILLDETASNGDLTIDLNGKTAVLASTFLSMDSALTNFDLTIMGGGSVTTTTAEPTVVLNGSGNNFELNNTTLINTIESSNAGYVINDGRYGNSYSVLKDSTLTSAHTAAIALFSTETNIGDASLLYYIKDCELTGVKAGTWAPATISSLTTFANGSKRPGYCVILDNVTYPTGEEAAPLTNLSDASVRSVSNPPEEAIIAEISFGKLFSVKTDCIDERLALAEMIGRNAAETATLKLLQNVTVDKSAPVGVTGVTSAFTVDFNGKKLEGEALVNPTGGEGTKVTINLTGELGNDDQMIKIFANADAMDYTASNSYVIEKGRYFTNYSLNLEENVTINLYTDGENGKPAKVYYLLDGERKDAVPGSANEWMITELAAKDMGKTVDAYAFETVDGTTYVDFSKNISVAGYVDTKPGEDETDANVQETLNKTLDTMMIYGELANRFFNGNFAALTEDETKALIGKDAAAIDTTNLVDTPRAVSQTIPNRAEDNTLKAGYWGTSAVLEDSISIKMYFYGAMFNDVTAKVKYGDGSYVAADLVTQESGFKYVKTSVAAKDFDTAITVALFDGETELGTVTDRVSSYTSRIGNTENAYNLAQALRAYGADAKRYAEAKGAAADAT